MRLQNKFLAVLLPGGAIAAGLVLFLIGRAVHAIVLDELRKNADVAATDAAQDAAPGLRDRDEARLLPLLQTLQKQEGAAYAEALGPDGTVLADTTVTDKGRIERDALARTEKPASRLLDLRGLPLMEVSVPVWAPASAVEADSFLLSGVPRESPVQRLGVLKLGVPMNPSLATESRILRRVLLIVVTIGVVSLGFVLLLVRGVLKPVRGLMAGIAGVSRGRYDVDIAISSRDELGELARSFNRMSVELARTTVSKEYVEGILENMLDLLVVTNPEGRIESVNRAMSQALAYPAAELVGRPLFFLFSDGRIPLSEKEFRARLESGDIRDLEASLKTGSGREIPVLFSASVLKDRDGRPRGYIGVAKDMTERKRAEEALVAAKTAAESASKELESFSYSVAHDLRAPLRAIDGFSQLLLQDHAGKLDDEGKGFLHRVRAGSQRMGQLIDDMLGLSRVTRGAMRREKFDLSGLAREIAAQLRATQPERVAEFVIAEGLQAEGDPSLLRAALENLLGNAWKYTRRHTRARIEFGRTVEPGRTVYFVRDDGSGFDMAFAKKLFQPFSRLHSAAEFEGTGIGLATVQRIIERHGGRIWGEGEVEKGSVFYFTLGERT